MHFMDFIPAESDAWLYVHVPTALYWQERVELDLDSPSLSNRILCRTLLKESFMRKEARSPSSTEQKEVTIFTRASVLQDVNLYIGVKYYKS